MEEEEKIDGLEEEMRRKKKKDVKRGKRGNSGKKKWKNRKMSEKIERKKLKGERNCVKKFCFFLYFFNLNLKIDFSET